MRLMILSAVAKLLGIQFHVKGFPFGAQVVLEPGVSGSTPAG